jgi:hypothetical protein
MVIRPPEPEEWNAIQRAIAQARARGLVVPIPSMTVLLEDVGEHFTAGLKASLRDLWVDKGDEGIEVAFVPPGPYLPANTARPTQISFLAGRVLNLVIVLESEAVCEDLRRDLGDLGLL